MRDLGPELAEAINGPTRLEWVEVSGLRTLDRLRLDLSPLTVLIGANGSGKSSLLQALEILRSATSTAFASDLERVHGWPYRLAREPGSHLRLRCRLHRLDRGLEYTLEVDERGLISTESLTQTPIPVTRNR